VLIPSGQYAQIHKIYFLFLLSGYNSNVDFKAAAKKIQSWSVILRNGFRISSKIKTFESI